MKPVALVTGGASGIGLATVKKLATDGVDVIMIDLPQSKGQQEADKIGASVTFVATDVTSEEEVRNAVSMVQNKFGKLDILVNCAAIAKFELVFDPSISTTDVLDTFRRTCKVNLFGTYNVVCQAGRLMTQNKPDKDGDRGVIINTGSITAEKAFPQTIAYSTTKGGIHGLMNPLTQELAPYGIRVVTVAPGYTDTPLVSSVMNDKAKEAASAGIPYPSRLGRPDEMASLVSHIISNKYINGTTVHINGGLLTN